MTFRYNDDVERCDECGEVDCEWYFFSTRPMSERQNASVARVLIIIEACEERARLHKSKP